MEHLNKDEDVILRSEIEELPEYEKNNDLNDDDEQICRHCGGVVPLGSVICPDCECWWSK